MVPFPAEAAALAHTLTPEQPGDQADLSIGWERPRAREDQPPVRCQECHTWWQVKIDQAEPWACPGCGRLSVYGIQPGRCPRCDKVCSMLREGHRVRSLCLCHLTDAQRREMDRQARLDRRRDEQEELRRVEAEAMRAEAARGAAEARTCWERRRRQCDVRRSDPAYDYCRVCPRWL